MLSVSQNYQQHIKKQQHQQKAPKPQTSQVQRQHVNQITEHMNKSTKVNDGMNSKEVI